MRFTMDTVLSGYNQLCQHVKTNGYQVSPRGMGCREMIGAQIMIMAPDTDALPIGIGRNLNPAIGAAEALQLVGGVSTPRLLERIAPNFANFMDGEAFAGAYGPRIRWQLPEIVRRLTSDAYSRQALVSIWDPAFDLYGESRDVPCTLALQFFLRDDRLHAVTTMRSNDLWWGFAYDIFQFATLQRVIADALSVDIGSLTHNVGSLHLYDRNLEDVEKLTLPERNRHKIRRLSVPGERIEDVQERARTILGRPARGAVHDPDAPGAWFDGMIRVATI